MPTPLETVKQDFNFDAKLAEILRNQARQPKKLAIPEIDQLVEQVRTIVNPTMIARVDQWAEGEGADLGRTQPSSEHGDLSFNPPQEFLALMRRMVEAQQGGKPSRKETRRRMRQLKTEVAKGVAKIKVKRRS